jgi:cytochrome c-type biogenesis protein
MNAGALLLVFLEGLLAFVSPCILPMLPVYFLYLSGESTSELDTLAGENKKVQFRKGKLVVNTIFFIIGFTIVFLMLGATSTAIGQTLSNHRTLLERVSGAVIILLGIHMTGLIRIPFLNRDHRLNTYRRKSSLLSSFLLGVAFSLGWSPCLGPFLGSALLLSGQSSTLLEGMILLFVFSMGLAIPFLLAGMLFEELTVVFVWIKKHMNLIKIVSGSLLIILGLLMLLGWFGYYARLF